MVIVLALLLAGQAASGGAGSDAQTDAEAAVIANCDAHKFETTVHTVVSGKMRSSRVRLCGKVGQTDAAWLRTLKDAIDKVAMNGSMSAEAKDQVITALNLEIAKVSTGGGTSPPQAINLTPPLAPGPASAVGEAVGAPITGPSLGGPVEYSVLPPFPAPKPAASAVVAGALIPSLPAPRMTFRCLATNALNAEGPCDLLERDTLFMVHADEDLPGGTSLRFLRRGDDRAEVELAQLKRGQTQRFILPARVCQGVAGSRVEIQIVRATKGAPQVVATNGPFELRC
jgi:hypothetical protein